MTTKDTFFSAIKNRDKRFDGLFFYGVRTTGIYCRPICPARPHKKNLIFFESSIAAEQAGYRPCKRCRPDASFKSPAWMGKAAPVARALRILESKKVQPFDGKSFADSFGFSERHMRRLFVDEMGVTPKQWTEHQRLQTAVYLITSTSLSITDIAFAAGFRSIRRFNDVIKTKFNKSPREIRHGRK